MDTLRGNFDDRGSDDQYDAADEDVTGDAPPPEIGTDERRMQVRAYNHWASLLADRNFPTITQLKPNELPDFGPNSVLLDFTPGIEDPVVEYLGDKLAGECDAELPIQRLSDVPSRSLLSRITDHYMQILANQAPIGFEAEFVNQRGSTILYRGILLPFSSDDETIDYIYGVINWKEMADQITTDELLLEIDQALEAGEPVANDDEPMADWADGPGTHIDGIGLSPIHAGADSEDGPIDFPQPAFGAEEEPAEDDDDNRFASLLSPSEEDQAQDADSRIFPEPVAYAGPEGEASAIAGSVAETDGTVELAASQAEDDEGLYDCLAAARELAQAARSSEDRSRAALYAAVGRAYDVSLSAQEEPEEFTQIVSENGLTVQDRAPMTPIVKLVFGADYDKTRLTEYAAVLAHAHREQLERGSLAGYLNQAEGGLKGVVNEERRMRREEAGKPAVERDGLREQLAKSLRDIEPQGFDAIAEDGAEFALVMIRRMPDGQIAMIGEIADDVPLIERAARKLANG